jgi:hypothetical protein
VGVHGTDTELVLIHHDRIPFSLRLYFLFGDPESQQAQESQDMFALHVVMVLVV